MQAYRDQKGLPWLETLWQDVHFGLRQMRKNPTFTLIAVLTLGLGIGANSAVFSLVDALYLRPLAVPHSEQLVRVYAAGPSGDLLEGFSYPEFKLLRGRVSSFTALSAEYYIPQLHMVTENESGEVQGTFVSANYFDVLGIQPHLGRVFRPEEDTVPNRDEVAVISDDLWKTRFHADPAILGREIRVNSVSYTVIGVAPPAFHGDSNGLPSDIWVPMMMLGAAGRACDDGTFNCSLIDQVIGRLAPQQSIANARVETRSKVVWSATNWLKSPRQRQVVIKPANGMSVYLPEDSAVQMRLLMIITSLLLLVSCANLGGLLLARGVTRKKELAVRLSIGARRSRIIRQLLTEGLLLAVLGGALGLGLAHTAKDYLAKFYAFDSEGFRRFYPFQFDWRVFAYSIVLALFAGILFSLVPAIRASRQNILGELKGGTPFDNRTGGWLRQILVIGQVALSVVLVVAAGLLIRSSMAVTKGTNFDPSHIVVFRLRPELIKYTPQQMKSLIQQVNARLSAVPGVQSTAFMLGIDGLVWNGGNGHDTQLSLPGQLNMPNTGITVLKQDVSPNFFQTLGIPLLQGREFYEQDQPGTPKVAVVNEALASRLWPGTSAVGQTLLIDGQPHQVIGLSANIQPSTQLHPPEPHLYLSYWQSNGIDKGVIRMAVRVFGDPVWYLPVFRRVIQSIDQDIPIGEDMSMSEQIDLEYMPVLLASRVTLFCGLLALCLSAMGLYSVLAFAVQSRTREIGIRMALGAKRENVLRMIVGQGVRLAGAGVFIGIASALLLTRLAASLLFGVRSSDPTTYVSVAVILFVTALAACYVPAMKATHIDPMQALRTE